jgi:hypothetical protein
MSFWLPKKMASHLICRYYLFSKSNQSLDLKDMFDFIAPKQVILAPLARPLQIIPGYVARQQESLIIKESVDINFMKKTKSSKVSFTDGRGKPAETFLEVNEDKTGHSIVTIPNTKTELFRIEQLQGKHGRMYFYATAQGMRLWSLEVDRGHLIKSTSYGKYFISFSSQFILIKP